MRLFIAEKPSVAKAIAAELGLVGKKDGYLECSNDNVITWCFGHMLEQAEPDFYTPDDIPRNRSGKKIWRTEDLPIIPQKWVISPKDEAKKQLNIISKLLNDATEVVNAGDPDREGCCLVDEVLDYYSVTLPVKRFWVSSQDSVTVKRGLSNLKDNNDFSGWTDAARGRARADWLIGMNLSRAFTLRAQRGGSGSLVTVGRVQTPTLALVVQRDKEIESFKPIPYHTIDASIKHGESAFKAKWKAGEDQIGLDSEGRLIDTSVANNLVSQFSGASGVVTSFTQEAKSQPHPLSFSLSDITVIASKDFGYSAEEVLKACQSLYEKHKLTSYPRTDCSYLPEAQHGDAKAVLAAVLKTNPELAGVISKCDTTIKSRTWNDKKITAHHGIIPTMHAADKGALSEIERNIYDVIVKGYLAQFYPLHKFMKTRITLDVTGEVFEASGRVIQAIGWKAVFSLDEDDESNEDQGFPNIKEGDAVVCHEANRRDSKTKPPASFTEGSLIRAMENIHKFVTDPAHKKMLREGDGIGTSATRASIISELKNRDYLTLKGKKLISTELGRSAISVLPEVVKSPVLTALYERMLKAIEAKEETLDKFIAQQEDFIRKQTAKANDGAVTLAGGKKQVPVSDKFKCHSCDSGLQRRPTKKKGVFWWGCSRFPTCEISYPDIKGKPNYEKPRDGSKK